MGSVHTGHSTGIDIVLRAATTVDGRRERGGDLDRARLLDGVRRLGDRLVALLHPRPRIHRQ